MTKTHQIMCLGISLVLSQVFAGCGQGNASPLEAAAYSAALDSAFHGKWLDQGCTEGETGPDLPPPVYYKGVLRFADGGVYMSSRLFDDDKCTVPRPGEVAEIKAEARFGSRNSDSSVPVDLHYETGGYIYDIYSLMKVRGGKLYMMSFTTPSKRPKTLDEKQAQVFETL